MAIRMDPFALFSIGAELVLLGFGIFILSRIALWLKGRKNYETDMEARAWARAVLDPDGPVRPKTDRIKAIMAGQAVRHLGPVSKHPILFSGAIATVLVILGAFGILGPLIETVPPPMPPEQREYYIVMKPYQINRYYNLTACPERTATYIYGSRASTVIITLLQLDDDWREPNAYNVTWEFAVRQSTVCPTPSSEYWSLVSYKQVGD